MMIENFTEIVNQSEATTAVGQNITFEETYNLTEAVNELEATTAVGQNLNEAVTAGLLKSTKSMSDNVFARIHMYGLIILTPLGLIFNSVSVVVFQKSKIFTTSIGNHLKFIAISDSIMLVEMLFTNTNQYWEEKLHFPDIYSLNNASCKLFTFIKLLGVLSSGLIMSSATVERFLAIAFPLKYRSWNTLRISRIILSVLIIFSLGVSAFPLFLYEVSKKRKCIPIEKYNTMTNLIYTILIMVIANGICGGVILTFTVLIIVLLFHQSRKRNVLSNNNARFKFEERYSNQCYVDHHRIALHITQVSKSHCKEIHLGEFRGSVPGSGAG